MDSDDEVRDRVALALKILESPPAAAVVLNRELILSNVDVLFFLTSLSIEMPLSLASLERSLKDYIDGPTEQPFDIKTVPVETVQQPSMLDQFSERVESRLL